MPEKCTDGPCPYLPRIEALERDSQHNKNAHKEFYGKLENSHTAVALIEERMAQIKADTEEIKTAVQELRSKPAKRWEGLVEKALWAVCAAVISFLLARAGL